ncbi:beta-hydroxyacyl-ACP dehydratase [Bacillus thuringiensis]|jgi:3-hydroxyacyl-[acyl-carrier-protein] dehydratase|uniref:Beta-hydroxyacyl-ACP dehydratase n=2 Tax=Bacillus thuringiensis TaxID=1428 RepID=A0AB35PET6_BACTU|nr:MULTISPECIES: 3-hydroxyacyl-ACP dehydratase FabZ family protein [Bacillus]EAO54841.1 (3R)-hydroxymyristoyl-[acyl carrier protein] dehydratase [Bacillus thuringiensis serovar israelensis ATCC 35646]MED1157988.1 beta-hydroxyacyl-ACP dehydratase [Bacillus paranthracis]AJH03336.1 fabA-like domain protein [Bacillus thuringiensis HD1002]APF32637.1 beta-hydroxyacyl-ACP dehydratase [Bacillus thuringiensis serovar israelensis]EEM98788.1 (3R)-hydroxymyristoyl-[acyl carrier protein] dehydratase [Bacil
MELEKILEVVPIRKPMLCIDNICEIIYGQSAKGYRNIKRDEDWAKGHFINDPIFPGTLIIETMAQIGAFIFYNEENPQLLKSYLGKVNDVKFLQKVIPDCRMYINAEIVMKIKKMARIRCEALVNDEIVAQGELTLYYMEDLL